MTACSRPATGAIEPHLATAWSYNAAKTVLTLTLRTGVKFTDGTPFDASVAAQNLKHSRRARRPMPATWSTWRRLRP